MIQAKPGQILLERRKELPSAPVAERTEPVRTGVLPGRFPEVTLRELVERWNRGAPGSGDLVSRVKQWEAVTPAGKVLGVVRAPTRETARDLAWQAFVMDGREIVQGDGVGGVLVRYVGTVVQVIRKGGES